MRITGCCAQSNETAYCVCDSLFVNSTGRVSKQHIIIITPADLFDDPLFHLTDAWISYGASRYVNDNLIKNIDRSFSNLLIEGTVL